MGLAPNAGDGVAKDAKTTGDISRTWEIKLSMRAATKRMPRGAGVLILELRGSSTLARLR
jgi:hypothetical protein